MFCPKCGSIMLKQKCGCGYFSEEKKVFKLTESGKSHKKSVPDVVDTEKEEKTLPETDADCHGCGNKRAYFWEVQTRAADEPPTKFFKCTKCKHTWRDYS